ncbi:cytochrome c heme lyase [Schizosaccharomyces japonicus yFS275]|uniref:Holocytochrome c-type synthase n=1 Tax=Schizosaccharomyces japonicus (strain yFS275 / FY16936) TaxID=402676 RepID=B6K5N2_SCHJY|nr:cytochrome c heme lyase [Schizosaccharomyces japonicus yFS275]EEB08836.1 cytochrome c heme lyase [Schizosaccharomyces japonicus yFS275]
MASTDSSTKPTSSSQAPPAAAGAGGACPVADTAGQAGLLARWWPFRSSRPRPHQSSIPKPDGSFWEYPSPEQMQRALERKGYEQSPHDVPMMVQVHNFLNEGVWHEIVAWEKLARPHGHPTLQRFEGRAAHPSPRARWYALLGRLAPTRYGGPPFDRHDWYVQRDDHSVARYVIDYYEAPDSPDGAPVFSLDVRPAMDSWELIKLRAKKALVGFRTAGSDSPNQ